MTIYGYFTDSEAETPAYDPGLAARCPVCEHQLMPPMITISFMVEGDARSYFYRVHSSCYKSLTDDQRTALDSVIVDAVYAARNVN